MCVGHSKFRTIPPGFLHLQPVHLLVESDALCSKLTARGRQARVGKRETVSLLYRPRVQQKSILD